MAKYRQRPWTSSNAEKRQRWMREFQERAVTLGAHPGQIDWDTASHLFNEGAGPWDAADRVYGKR